MGYDRRTGGASDFELAAHPWRFRCEVDGCYYSVCADTEEQAELETYGHPCPWKEGPMGLSIIDKAWAQLDAEVDEILALAPLVESERLLRGDQATAAVWAKRRQLAEMKARARGKAEILALLAAEHFPTADAISTEAGVRYGARQAGVQHHTPGTTAVAS